MIPSRPRILFHLMTLLVLLPATSALADADASASEACPYATQDRASLMTDHLADLKQKLDIRADQLAAWNAWSATVLSDVRKQSTDECHNLQQWTERMDNSDALDTPALMQHQENDLRDEIAGLQKQLASVEAAERNTANFYATLDRKQKTIFDLFWRLEHATQFHHGMMMRHYGHPMVVPDRHPGQDTPRPPSASGPQ